MLDSKIALASLSLFHFSKVECIVTAILQASKTPVENGFWFTKHCFSHFLFALLLYCLSYVRSLNELRVLLLESHRHSRDMEKDLSREVHKAEWKVKEQKLQDDIKTLREKLLLLVRKYI